MTVTVAGVEYTCDSALRGDDYVLLFTDNVITYSFYNVTDFDDFVLSGGEWSYPYVTLLSTGWVGDSAPYTQQVDVVGVTSTNDVIVTPRMEEVTQTDLDNFANAMIVATHQGLGTVTFSAFGYKPSVDLKFNVRPLV